MKMNNITETQSGAQEQEWKGCEWTTQHGDYCLDLDGVEAAEAREKADIIRQIDTDDWDDADHQYVRAQLDGLVSSIYSDRLQDLLGEEDYDTLIEELAVEWDVAAEWLEQVEQDAAKAWEHAQEARRSLKLGEMEDALAAAKAACALEIKYGDCPTYKGLLLDVEDAYKCRSSKTRPKHGSTPKR